MRGENPEGIDGLEAINIQYTRSNQDTEVDLISDKETIGKFIDLGFSNDHRYVP